MDLRGSHLKRGGTRDREHFDDLGQGSLGWEGEMVRVNPKFLSGPSLVKRRRGFPQPLVQALAWSKIALLFTFDPGGEGFKVHL